MSAHLSLDSAAFGDHLFIQIPVKSGDDPLSLDLFSCTGYIREAHTAENTFCLIVAETDETGALLGEIFVAGRYEDLVLISRPLPQ